MTSITIIKVTFFRMAILIHIFIVVQKHEHHCEGAPLGEHFNACGELDSSKVNLFKLKIPYFHELRKIASAMGLLSNSQSNDVQSCDLNQRQSCSTNSQRKQIPWLIQITLASLKTTPPIVCGEVR